MTKVSSTLFLTAKTLSRYVRTDWSNYDFTENSSELERRVPQIIFDVEDVKVVLNEVQKNDGNRVGYTRECQVEYLKHTFIYKMIVISKRNGGFDFKLEVYTPAGDGKGGIYKLFSEKLWWFIRLDSLWVEPFSFRIIKDR